MLFLPELTVGGAEIRLPAADCCAAALAEALLVDAPSAAERLLADALAESPSLVLWTILYAERETGAALKTLDAAAAWLAPRLLDALQDAQLATTEREAEASSAARHWAEMTGRRPPACRATPAGPAGRSVSPGPAA